MGWPRPTSATGLNVAAPHQEGRLPALSSLASQTYVSLPISSAIAGETCSVTGRETASAKGHETEQPLAPGVRPTADDVEWLERVREAIEEGFRRRGAVGRDLAERLAVHRGQLHNV